jgi:hypothetical protein
VCVYARCLLVMSNRWCLLMSRRWILSMLHAESPRCTAVTINKRQVSLRVVDGIQSHYVSDLLHSSV